MPLALAERRLLRLAAMCLLYVAQGIPYGFVTVTLAAYLAGQGASTDAIGGVLALSGLPWTFKFLLGPLLDRGSRSRMGRRRPWILLAQAMMIATSSLLVALPDPAADLARLGWILLACNTFVALQDVAVDALAVDLLPESERGLANGLMHGAAYVGVWLGGSVLSGVVARDGLRAALLAQIAALAALSTLPLLVRERAGDDLLSLRRRDLAPGETPRSLRQLFGDLLRAFARRSPLLGVAWAVAVYVGVMALATIATVLLVQRLGWTQAEYGERVGGFATLICGALGSVAGGWIADRLGHRRVLAAASLGLALLWFGFAALEARWSDSALVVRFFRVEAGLTGVLGAAFFALAMDLSWPRVAATQFSAYMALASVSRTIGVASAGGVERWLGPAGAYVAFGVLQIAILAILVPMDPRQNRRELGD